MSNDYQPAILISLWQMTDAPILFDKNIHGEIGLEQHGKCEVMPAAQRKKKEEKKVKKAPALVEGFYVAKSGWRAASPQLPALVTEHSCG